MENINLNMNILFTSVGRRVELIQAFRNASEKLNINLQIYGVDISKTAPALSFCDHSTIVHGINTNQYIPELQQICIENNIDLLIPTIDTELMVIAQNKNIFGKTNVVVSKPEKIAMCCDKKYTANYFNSIGLKSPQVVDDWKEYRGKYPAFIKPKEGSSSISAYKVKNIDELKLFAERVPDYIVQPFIDGVEYTVDILCDFNGNPIFITPRIRLAVRAGEVLKTQISQDPKIIFEIKQLISDYKPCGQITVQLIRDRFTGEDYYIEINPRFGGGAPLSIKAGANSAEMLLRLVNGEQIGYIEKAAEDGAIFSRYDQSIRLK